MTGATEVVPELLTKGPDKQSYSQPKQLEGASDTKTRDLAKVLRCPATTMHYHIIGGWHVQWGGGSSVREVAHQWGWHFNGGGWHISGGGMSVGGGTSVGDGISLGG